MRRPKGEKTRELIDLHNKLKKSRTPREETPTETYAQPNGMPSRTTDSPLLLETILQFCPYMMTIEDIHESNHMMYRAVRKEGTDSMMPSRSDFIYYADYRRPYKRREIKGIFPLDKYLKR